MSTNQRHPHGTNDAPLIADPFRYTEEAEFLMESINKPERRAFSVSFLDIYLKFDISGQHCV